MQSKPHRPSAVELLGYLVFAVFVLWVGLRWNIVFVKWCVAQ